MDMFRHHLLLMQLLSVLADIPRGTPKSPLSTAAKADPDQIAFAATDAAIARDTGMSAEDATGIRAYQPDLPFFMQSGFGKR